MSMRIAPYILIAVSFVPAFLGQTSGVVDRSNLGNGWYPDGPVVSVEKIQPVLDCLVGSGVATGYRFETEHTTHLTGDLPHGPTIIVWSGNSGREFRNDAVLTYRSPQVAYNDIARAFGQPYKIVDCAPKGPQVLVEITNPVGAPMENQEGRYHSAPGDKFAIGAEYTDSTGITWVKKRGWYAFFPYGYWQQKVQK